MTHGSYSTYVNKGCRCDDCKQAGRVYRKHRKASPIGRRDEARARAYVRATARLRSLHHDEFQRLYQAELDRERAK